MIPQNKRVFLGFSLTEQQTQIVSLVQRQLPNNVRLVPKNNLHMTLAFLGEIGPDQLSQLNEQVTLIKKRTIEVTLDQLVYWEKPKIICLKGIANDASLLQLTKDTKFIAKNLNLHRSEYTYTPHITLCRKAKSEMEALIHHISHQPLTLSPKQLHLFESFLGKNGVEYPILESWTLG
ncbi:RNA 2',3'-cyclic phosphodiesterase [uncultured Shewanella sp.]|uniref:RNA 2',3'-cyclic phosphodiesterase n=1 Tax=uncultured Shewanella sp. TaxID=173975 RepID=UPI002634A6C8|nr:RNA 2',3'-cyclic phosphodiesterase [uncultured Shewanella sp.]